MALIIKILSQGIKKKLTKIIDILVVVMGSGHYIVLTI